jgi:hypothetical protein
VPVVDRRAHHEDSKRKALATRRGLATRRDEGKPVGAVPLGYTWEHVLDDQGKPVYQRGRPVTRRIIDPTTSPTVKRIFDMVQSGATFGDVARALNAEGIVGRRGKPWVSRTVRTIVHNGAYTGQKGYPKLVEPERWQDIQRVFAASIRLLCTAARVAASRGTPATSCGASRSAVSAAARYTHVSRPSAGSTSARTGVRAPASARRRRSERR